MYKVFFNDSTIELGQEAKKSLKDNINILNVDEGYSFVNQIVLDIESGKKSSGFFILTHDIEHTWNLFRNAFTEIPAAGGLVQNSKGELLFIRRLGIWDLPKGKIEKKESPEKAAIREVEEECGLTGFHVIRQLDSTFHIYRSPYISLPDSLVLKETKWFLMNYSGNEKPIPQLEENIEEVRWVKPEELPEVMKDTYSSLREFLNNNLPLIAF